MLTKSTVSDKLFENAFWRKVEGFTRRRPDMRNLSLIKSLHHKKITAIIFVITIIVTFSVASETFPADSGTEYQKALQYYNNRKYKEAVKLFKEYAKKKPDATVYYRIGYALYQLREFDEANGYFKEAYLIDPGFSPGPIRTPKEYPQEEKKIEAPDIKPDIPKKEANVVPLKEKQPLVKQEVVKEKPPIAVQPQKSEIPAATPLKESAPPESKKVVPGPDIQTQVTKTPYSTHRKDMPLNLLVLIVYLILIIVFYVYFSLCLFSIAKKLNVPSPWLAWIPIVSIWTIVSAARKPWWWILLLIVPIINIVIGIYLWICITENLGKNKLLGLLMLVPLVNLLFLGFLAFSREGKPVETPETATTD
jgi:hypothetical protein